MKRLAARLALAAGTFVVLVALLEVGLRIAGGFVERERGGARAATTILCVGDSHTFGLHVPPHLSYPALLQRELDPAAREIGVVNYGVPGRNSAALLRRLPAYLESMRPDLLLVLVGFNDSWNVDGAADDGGAAPAPSWSDDLRVLKLLRLARLNVEGEKTGGAPRVFERDGRMMVEEDGVARPAAAGGAAFGTIEGAALRAQVARNVTRIVTLARDRGAKPVLLTYATENQPCFLDLNANARELAAALGCDLIEAAIPFRDAIAREGYGAWFFGDDHPNARGNELFAGIVADALVARGLARRVESAAVTSPSLPAALRPGKTGGRFLVSGPPRRDFQVAFSPRLEPRLEFHGVELPIADDPMLHRCLENLNLRGRTDDRGEAVVDVDLSRLGGAAGTTLHGIVVFFDSATRAGVGAVSPPLAIAVP